MKVGYVRVSRQEQNPEMQRAELEADGCEQIFEERISSREERRPELERALEYMALGRSGQGSPIILVGGAFQHRAIDPQTAHALYCGRLGKSSVDPDIERGVQGSSVRLTKVAAACPISCGESSWTKCAPRTMTSS
jgi:hypothetical protein